MSDVRCRACGAAVAPNASWCSLCYADLRTVAAPAAPAAAAQPAPGMVAAAARAEIAVAPTAAAAMRATVTAAAADVLDAATPLPDAAGQPAGAEPSPTWPCTRCGAKVAIELDACDSCGAGFLAGAAAGSTSLALPVVGDLTRMSSGQRLLVALGVAIGLCVLLVLLAEVFGHVL